MRNPQGYLTIVGAGPQVERDTVTCGHCQQIIAVKPRSAATVYLVRDAQGREKEEPGACCRVCMRAVCLTCHAHGRCTPWEKRLEKAERRQRLLRAVAQA